MSDIKMSDLQLVLERGVIDRLEKATAGALTAAYETRRASLAPRGISIDETVVKNEIMGAYYEFCALLGTTDPRSRNQP